MTPMPKRIKYVRNALLTRDAISVNGQYGFVCTADDGEIRSIRQVHDVYDRGVPLTKSYRGDPKPGEFGHDDTRVYLGGLADGPVTADIALFLDEGQSAPQSHIFQDDELAGVVRGSVEYQNLIDEGLIAGKAARPKLVPATEETSDWRRVVGADNLAAWVRESRLEGFGDFTHNGVSGVALRYKESADGGFIPGINADEFARQLGLTAPQ